MAVISAAEKNVAVATRDLLEPRDTPQRKCPLVQPEPSYRQLDESACQHFSMSVTHSTPKANQQPRDSSSTRADARPSSQRVTRVHVLKSRQAAERGSQDEAEEDRALPFRVDAENSGFEDAGYAQDASGFDEQGRGGHVQECASHERVYGCEGHVARTSCDEVRHEGEDVLATTASQRPGPPGPVHVSLPNVIDQWRGSRYARICPTLRASCSSKTPCRRKIPQVVVEESLACRWWYIRGDRLPRLVNQRRSH